MPAEIHDWTEEDGVMPVTHPAHPLYVPTKLPLRGDFGLLRVARECMIDAGMKPEAATKLLEDIEQGIREEEQERYARLVQAVNRQVYWTGERTELSRALEQLRGKPETPPDGPCKKCREPRYAERHGMHISGLAGNGDYFHPWENPNG